MIFLIFPCSSWTWQSDGTEHMLFVQLIRFWTFNSWISCGVRTVPGGGRQLLCSCRRLRAVSGWLRVVFRWLRATSRWLLVGLVLSIINFCACFARVMLKDANNANSMHSSYTGRATTASVINYCLPYHSLCFSLTCTMLTPEQLTVELFWFSMCSVHDSKPVHLHSKILTHTMVCWVILYWPRLATITVVHVVCVALTCTTRACNGLRSYLPMA